VQHAIFAHQIIQIVEESRVHSRRVVF